MHENWEDCGICHAYKGRLNTKKQHWKNTGWKKLWWKMTSSAKGEQEEKFKLCSGFFQWWFIMIRIQKWPDFNSSFLNRAALSRGERYGRFTTPLYTLGFWSGRSSPAIRSLGNGRNWNFKNVRKKVGSFKKQKSINRKVTEKYSCRILRKFMRWDWLSHIINNTGDLKIIRITEGLVCMLALFRA